jgi:hypothetical protein
VIGADFQDVSLAGAIGRPRLSVTCVARYAVCLSYRGDSPMMLARIGVMRALNRNVEPKFASRPTLGTAKVEARHVMKLIHRFRILGEWRAVASIIRLCCL